MAAKAKDLHHIVEGIIGKVLGVGENQADLELVAVADGAGAATCKLVCACTRTTCSAACIQ
jgi:hypothetical protein